MKKFFICILLIIFCFFILKKRNAIKLFASQLYHQKINSKKHYEKVTIPSSHNNADQDAYFLKSNLAGKQPLVVSLHTWGGTYKQQDSLLDIVKEKNWNYIHPDYGGPQWLKNSCCFDASTEYIDDAINYAINNSNVDTSKIIVIGKSGGGSGVLATLLKSKYKNLHFMCWSPITDYISWHQEVQKNENLKNKYLAKIMAGTNSITAFDSATAKLKSPYYFNFKKVKNKQFKTITIYIGINDGTKGWSTSISQPIKFYNKILQSLDCKDSSKYVSSKEHKELLEMRGEIKSTTKNKLGNRRIIFTKTYNAVKLIIFDGGHEILFNAVKNELKL